MNKSHIFSITSLTHYSYDNSITSGTAPGLCCADLWCPALSSGPNKHYEKFKIQAQNWALAKHFMKKRRKAPPPGDLPCQGSFLLVSSPCRVGNLPFGCCVCQCSLEWKKLLGWTTLKWHYLAELFNKTLCREIYFIQNNVLSLVTPLTSGEEISFLSWWWFFCSIKSNDKAPSAFNGTRN